MGNKIRWPVASSLILVSLLLTVFLPNDIFAQSSSPSTNYSNVIHFFAGLANEKGEAPRLFSYPLYILEQGESITWQNDDTRSHKLSITKEEPTTSQDNNDNPSPPSSPIYESQQIDPGGSTSYTFKDAGIYQVQSVTDSSLKGEVVVADQLSTLTNNGTGDDPVNVVLSWYPPTPETGENVYLKIQFLDKQTGKNHPHVDFTFTILNANGTQVAKDQGLIHSGEGKEFTVATFQSKGDFSPMITVRGINFIPITPDEVRFSMAVGPEFSASIISVVLLLTIGSIIIASRTMKGWLGIQRAV